MSTQFDEWDVTDVSMHALFPILRLLLSDQFRVFKFGNILLRIMMAFEICTLAHIKSLRWVTQAFAHIFTKALRTHLTRCRIVVFVYPFRLVIKKPERNKLWVALNADGCVVGFSILYTINKYQDGWSSCELFFVLRNSKAGSCKELPLSWYFEHALEGVGARRLPSLSWPFRLLWKWVIVGPLQIRLSTISLLSIAESYYVKKGFSLLSHLHLNGYDLDVFEKTVRN